MKKSISSVSLLTALLMTACVTINVYFPAAAAETAADEIIHGIQGDSKNTPEAPESSLSNWQLISYQWIDKILSFTVSPAYAGGANLDIDTAEIRQLRASMKKRYSSLQPYYGKGYIGIQSDGLLTTRNAGQIPLQDRNKVNKLVAAENRDRKNMYKAIANANGHPEWAEQIKSTFASSWVDNAKSGWWIQESNGNWKKK